MFRISFERLLILLALGYLLFNVWTLTEVFFPKSCQAPDTCVHPSWNAEDIYKVRIRLFSTDSSSVSTDGISETFTIASGTERTKNVTIPLAAFNNGTVIGKIEILDSVNSIFFSKTLSLTSYREPPKRAYQLFKGHKSEVSPNELEEDTRPVTHWLSMLYVAVLQTPVSFHLQSVPPEIHPILSVISRGGDYFYYPVFHVNPELQSTNDWVEVQRGSHTADTSQLQFQLVVKPLSIGVLRLRCILETTTDNFRAMGLKSKDVEQMRSIFTDTNFALLLTTFVVSILHVLFDFLAFKNDIAFWRRTDNTAGISLRVVAWRCISSSIIILYLVDERSSLLITIPTAISTVIELWKLSRMLKVSIRWSGGFTIGSRTAKEQETDTIDAQFMKRLLWLMLPLCLVGAIYSLLYLPHRSWYSWCLQTMVNGVYAFGFLLMTPQLFLNYRLKSVANLPWRALSYKAFNTFIDDFFAFIITMPTAHRVACFRDDIIFVIYIYQRWLYPVDYSRINEYGRGGDETKAPTDDNSAVSTTTASKAKLS